MQIIVINPRWSTSRTFHVSPRTMWGIAALVFFASAIIAAILWAITMKYAAHIPIPMLRETFMNAAVAEQKYQDQFVRENINTMAIQLGDLRAQMTRLEALAERVGGLAGIKAEFDFKNLPARGGNETVQSEGLTLPQLLAGIEKTSKSLEKRGDSLNFLETELMNRAIKGRSLPTVQPVAGVRGSGYGMRLDPITGRSAFHQGIDFSAPVGTAILAAAGGIVSVQEWHPGFGNLVDIDHGNGLISRYAHSSKVLVKAGDIVKAGQKIAEVGTTGRSTGPHLHFEVLLNDVPQNPMKFLGQTDKSVESALR